MIAYRYGGIIDSESIDSYGYFFSYFPMFFIGRLRRKKMETDNPDDMSVDLWKVLHQEVIKEDLSREPVRGRGGGGRSLNAKLNALTIYKLSDDYDD